MSSIQDPTARVRRKPKKDMAKMPAAAGLPEFSAPDYTSVERNHLRDLGQEIEPEIAYLKRLALRGQVSANPEMAQFVPAASDRELATGHYLQLLNGLNMSKNPNDRLKLEVLFSRFNSRSTFNVATEMSLLALQKRSVQEIDALISSGVDGMINTMSTGGAELAEKREKFHQAPRTS